VPLTQLDPTAALIVIDLQKGLVSLDTVHPTSEIVARSAQLARAFRERGLPVVLVNVTGGAPGRTNFVRARHAFAAEDLLITKQRPGAFIGTNLDEILRQRGVTQVFLTGIATGTGVEATARSAYDHGYHVVFVVDAITDRSAEAHSYCMENVFPKLGELDTTEAVLKLFGD